MSTFAIFEAGRNARRAPILKVCECPREDWMLQFRNMLPGQRSIEVEEGVTPETHYMVRKTNTGWGTAVRRPLPATLSKMTIRADNTDAAAITGLPKPCTVTIDGTPHEVTDGELTIRSPMAASYEIAVDHWPYLPWAARLTADSPMDISISKDLGALRGAALLRVDLAFGRLRARLDANADIHAAKLAEARMLVSVGASNRPAPLLSREAVATGTSLTALAEAVIARAAEAADRIAGLEVARQAAQAAIRSAATPAAIEAVVSDIESRECP